MKKNLLYTFAALIVVASMTHFQFAQSENAIADSETIQAAVFQAAGPTAGSIQGTIDQFRLALGVNNGNAPGPIAGGRREINWDGGGSTATSLAPTPFDGFLGTRGARFTTGGTGFVQAPVSGIAATFGNASYENIFTAFSPVRLFSPIGSNITDVHFFQPGGGGIAAETRGFGAVFTDVDQPGGRRSAGELRSRTVIKYFDILGRLIFRGLVPASPGNGSLSFFGVVINDARIARVEITAGAVPGADDDKADVVMMDDFIFGEPQSTRLNR